MSSIWCCDVDYATIIAPILLRVSNCKELALSVQPLLLRVSYRIISVVPIIAEGKIIAERLRPLYDYYALHAVNSAAATIIAERQELGLYYYVFYRKELALELVTFRVIVWRREIDDDDNQTKSVTRLDVLNRYVEYSDSFKNLYHYIITCFLPYD